MIHLRKNYGKFENRLNYTEIVVLESKKRKHSEFMNKLKLRMILWSTAEAVLRHIKFRTIFLIFNDPMVYCGSGTETVFSIYILIIYFDPMVYCGSGTETRMCCIFIIYI